MLAKAGGWGGRAVRERVTASTQARIQPFPVYFQVHDQSLQPVSCQRVTNKPGANAPPASPTQTAHLTGRRENGPPDASVPTSLEQTALAANAEASEHFQQL